MKFIVYQADSTDNTENKQLRQYLLHLQNQNNDYHPPLFDYPLTQNTFLQEQQFLGPAALVAKVKSAVKGIPSVKASLNSSK